MFDLDETLVDRRGSLIAYSQRLFSDFSGSIAVPERRFTEALLRLDGNGRAPKEQFYEALTTQLMAGVPAVQVREHFEASAWARPLLFHGVTDLLASLRREGWQIGIVTNGSVWSQAAKIERSGLSTIIDGFVISAAFGWKKPAPEIFRHMISLLHVNAADSWFVGDDPRADMRGAAQVGLRTCWIERYSPWPMDLPRCYDAKLSDTCACIGVFENGA